MNNFTIISGIESSGHHMLDFADIHVGRDNRLFVDPSRIHFAAIEGNPWAIQAHRLIESYFDALYAAAVHKDYAQVQALIQDTCGEMNATHLGYSHAAPSGTGASLQIIYPAICQMIDNGFFDQNLVTSMADVPIWAENLDADRLSDWITNIIWPVLYDFTEQQYLQYDLLPNFGKEFVLHRWNGHLNRWENVRVRLHRCNGHDILLCPKVFLHKRLLFTAEDFLRRQVLVYRQQVHLDNQSDLCQQRVQKDGSIAYKEPTKKALIEHEVKGSRHSDYLHRHTCAQPKLLAQYHQSFEYRPGNPENFISDDELDELLYG